MKTAASTTQNGHVIPKDMLDQFYQHAPEYDRENRLFTEDYEELKAAGHAESGNDLPLFYSSTKAEKTEGGWIINGHKNFGSLTLPTLN